MRTPSKSTSQPRAMRSSTSAAWRAPEAIVPSEQRWSKQQRLWQQIRGLLKVASPDAVGLISDILTQNALRTGPALQSLVRAAPTIGATDNRQQTLWDKMVADSCAEVDECLLIEGEKVMSKPQPR